MMFLLNHLMFLLNVYNRYAPPVKVLRCFYCTIKSISFCWRGCFYVFMVSKQNKKVMDYVREKINKKIKKYIKNINSLLIYSVNRFLLVNKKVRVFCGFISVEGLIKTYQKEPIAEYSIDSKYTSFPVVKINGGV